MIFTVPWPAKELSPNARVHWSKKSKAAKAYRDCCRITAMALGIKAPLSGKVLFALEFCPPDKRRRDDDNCLASFKSGRDGIAEAMGVDDCRFVTQLSMGEPVKGGFVRVTISAFISDQVLAL